MLILRKRFLAPLDKMSRNKNYNKLFDYIFNFCFTTIKIFAKSLSFNLSLKIKMLKDRKSFLPGREILFVNNGEEHKSNAKCWLKRVAPNAVNNCKKLFNFALFNLTAIAAKQCMSCLINFDTVYNNCFSNYEFTPRSLDTTCNWEKGFDYLWFEFDITNRTSIVAKMANYLRSLFLWAWN